MKLANGMGFRFPQYQPTPLEKLIPNASPEALDFIRACIHWDPTKRPTAQQCLDMPFFSGMEPIPHSVTPSKKPEAERRSTSRDEKETEREEPRVDVAKKAEPVLLRPKSARAPRKPDPVSSYQDTVEKERRQKVREEQEQQHNVGAAMRDPLLSKPLASTSSFIKSLKPPSLVQPTISVPSQGFSGSSASKGMKKQYDNFGSSSRVAGSLGALSSRPPGHSYVREPEGTGRGLYGVRSHATQDPLVSPTRQNGYGGGVQGMGLTGSRLHGNETLRDPVGSRMNGAASHLSGGNSLSAPLSKMGISGKAGGISTGGYSGFELPGFLRLPGFRTGIRVTGIPRVIGIRVTAILPVTGIPATGVQGTETITPAVKTITRGICLPTHSPHTDMGPGNCIQAILGIRR